jgi:hypothetical protein
MVRTTGLADFSEGEDLEITWVLQTAPGIALTPRFNVSVLSKAQLTGLMVPFMRRATVK